MLERLGPRAGVLVLAAVIGLLAGCGVAAPDDGASPETASQGALEVTAKLVDIAGEFPSNDLYDYAYVMRYEIVETHRGEASGVLLVGHYNPLKKRAEAADQRSGPIGGNVTRFREGDLHRMALDLPIDAYCMAGIINPYAEEGDFVAAPVYWAHWTNRVVP